RAPAAVRLGGRRRGARRRRAGGRALRGLPAAARPRRRRDEPDHRRPARVRPARHASGQRAARHGAARRGARAVGGDRRARHLGRARDRVFLDLPGGVLGHVGVVRGVPADARRQSGGALMLAHEFMRNALLAGTFVALACGLAGYFVVLRAEVFAGDALGHVAFTGALAAAAAGVDVRLGLFAATVLAALGMGAAGERARADDAVIGSFFAWVLGLGVLFLSIFTTSSSGGNGTAGVRVLFGSIFGLSAADARVAAVVGAGAALAVGALARPLLFSSVDPDVAR